MSSPPIDLQKLLANLNEDNSTGHHTLPQEEVSNIPENLIQVSHPYRGQPQSRIPGLGLLPADSEAESLPHKPAKVPNQPDAQINALTLDGSGSSRPAHSEESQIPKSKPSIPDASNITTWPAALKHLTKHLLPDQNFTRRIHGLIEEQHKLEEQWWNKRQSIEKIHAGRGETTIAVASILRSLGVTETKKDSSDTKVDKAELDAFDKQVYAYLMQMQSRFDKELRSLGVPFYAIKHDLVISEDSKEATGAAHGKIEKKDLRELQKRMLQTLEDLFGENDD